MERSQTFFIENRLMMMMMMNYSVCVIIKIGTDRAFSKSCKSRMRATTAAAAAAHGHH
jgi:hypothetical protein